MPSADISNNLASSQLKFVYVYVILLIDLFESNRDHRLSFRSVIIEQWMYTAQVPINNALVLSNLCEYRRK